MIKDKLIKNFGKNLKEVFSSIDSSIFNNTEEIRIRLKRGILIKCYDKEYIILKNFKILEYKNKEVENIYLPTEEDIKQTIEIMSNYSIYAFEQEFKNGFISLKDGFRVGIVGKVVFENNEIKTIKDISSLNIRIAREIKGCSNKILKYVLQDNVKNTIIISPPNCGKTTLLRDLIRNISNFGFNISIVDERAELASCFRGTPQNDLGIKTDILDRCPKSYGMLLLLRSMSPDVIAVDEIGTLEDIKAIQSISNSGVKIVCTIHSENLEEFRNKKNIKELLDNKIFERFIFLNRNKKVDLVSKIYNENFCEINLI